MIAVRLTKHFTVSTTADLDEHTDAVMEELLKLESAELSDADIAASLESGEVSVSVVAEAPTFEEAAALGDSAIRAAIHAAGGHTPEWADVEFVTRASNADLVQA